MTSRAGHLPFIFTGGMRPTADQLLDTVAGLLKDFGRYAFDLERQEARKTQALFEAWAQHALVGGEAPGSPQGSLKGAWNGAGLRADFAAHRKKELAEFSQSGDTLREVVSTFITSLNKEMNAERAEDSTLSQTLDGLGATLQNAPQADLRKLALEAVRQVQDVLTARRERQQQHLAELGERLETLGSQLEVARRESTIDALTQLYNRRAFDEQLSRVSELSQLKDGGAVLLLVDIDYFKKVNDTFGHPAGDAVLKAVAQATVRTFKRKGDFVARYGGEELAVLLRDSRSDDGLRLGERLRETIAALAIPHESQALKVTASVGVADWQRGEAATEWLARADAALYRAKQSGRNRVEK